MELAQTEAGVLLLGCLFLFLGLGIWIGLAVGLTIVGVPMLARWFARERLGLTKGAHQPPL